ncbi:NADP-dependent oxidoreductase [Vulcanimicrobium alpinum]|uniref:NADP-dependent oxidoreductase n=1 Tax=Vulcanimicrobium alpinum TaxID=3016050 RepID=A0AAN1XWB1_UNVUL|nr:NADP-dependent oxidoreductase [Vulcanimicrobium alpinum]BDE05453.1 NADP-dependent oxidoreductase [Vulcanimicrobium alpinum]
MTTVDTRESREIRLAARPSGEPTGANFALASTKVGPPGDGQVLVKNAMMSVEPYMRGRMNAGRSYVPPFEVGAPLSGAAIGTVVASKDASVSEGATVMHDHGWREYAVLPAKAVRAIDTTAVPAETYLSALGTTGFTAWVGLRAIGRVKDGETLFVSAAAGAVGSMAVQLAKRWGLRVIGSASSPAKAAFVRDTLGADAAFDYHDSVRTSLNDAAPEGIDCYFDNVGGEQLEAAIGAMRDFGRAILCGAVSQYNAASPPPGPRNLVLAVGRRLRLEGFIVLDHMQRFPEFFGEVAPLVKSGAIHAPTSFVDGLENAPGALLDILRPNAHLGKVVVRLA